MDKKKVLLSISNLNVKFRVRGRILTAIRGISLDIYENESIAIVGESGSGKSVFTKTFAGMLDSNGFISEGKIIFSDPELSDTYVKLNRTGKMFLKRARRDLNHYAKYENGAEIYKEILNLESEEKARTTISDEKAKAFDAAIDELEFQRVEAINLKQTLDKSTEKQRYRSVSAEIKVLEDKIDKLKIKKQSAIKNHQKAAKADKEAIVAFHKKMAELKQKYAEAISKEISAQTVERNELIAKEIYLSVGRFNLYKRTKLANQILAAFKKAMQLGVNLDDPEERARVYEGITFAVRYLDETETKLHGNCIINLAQVKYSQDWTQIRGSRIATVFQDPMTSLNPILTIGNQIMSVILKHQNCSETEARARALTLMKKVGIPNAENRFDDYPFQYSGGMRQRIVIAIALSCQPKILICDEPTTALDVTIQAQILKLLKDLQKEFNYTIVFITHDLGVVANVADRVAVMYAGQIIELGNVEDVFYDPRHPYTWALMSSLPQLAQRNTKLYSISGTPPSLYNSIVGDPFAPRNPYCLKIDTLKEPPMFRVSETHYAKTWLLDPRAPKVEKPVIIDDIHGKLTKAFNI